MTQPRPSQAELAAFLQAEFPQTRCTIEALDDETVLGDDLGHSIWGRA